MLIQGTGAERRTAVETVLSFDADWMRGQSVGIIPVRNSTPEPIIAEIEKIMDSGEGGLSQNLVKFQPIARLNAIMVVSQQAGVAAGPPQTWIARLDKSETASDRREGLPVKYGDAKQIAALLNEMFTGASGAAARQRRRTRSRPAPASRPASRQRTVAARPG